MTTIRTARAPSISFLGRGPGPRPASAARWPRVLIYCADQQDEPEDRGDHRRHDRAGASGAFLSLYEANSRAIPVSGDRPHALVVDESMGSRKICRQEVGSNDPRRSIPMRTEGEIARSEEAARGALDAYFTELIPLSPACRARDDLISDMVVWRAATDMTMTKLAPETAGPPACRRQPDERPDLIGNGVSGFPRPSGQSGRSQGQSGPCAQGGWRSCCGSSAPSFASVAHSRRGTRRLQAAR